MSFNPETPKAAALNPLPPVVMALFLMIAGVEALFALASIGVLGGGLTLPGGFGRLSAMA